MSVVRGRRLRALERRERRKARLLIRGLTDRELVRVHARADADGYPQWGMSLLEDELRRRGLR